MIPVGRIQLRYRRALDGELFCMNKFFLVVRSDAEEHLVLESQREKLANPTHFPPYLKDVANQFGGIEQQEGKDCH